MELQKYLTKTTKDRESVEDKNGNKGNKYKIVANMVGFKKPHTT